MGNLSLGPKNGIFSLYLSLARRRASLSLCASVPAGGLAGGAAGGVGDGGAEEHIYNAFGHISLGSSATLTQSASLFAGDGEEEEEEEQRTNQRTDRSVAKLVVCPAKGIISLQINAQLFT